VRSVVIVLPQEAPDVFPTLLKAPVLGQPHFLLLQTAMESLNVAVSLRVRVSRAAMGDPQPRQAFQEAGRSELRATVRGEGQAGAATARRKSLQDRLLDGRQGFLGPATVRQVPTDDLPHAIDDIG